MKFHMGACIDGGNITTDTAKCQADLPHSIPYWHKRTDKNLNRPIIASKKEIGLFSFFVNLTG